MRDFNGNKKSICRDIKKKKMTKKNVDLLLDWKDNLLADDTRKDQMPFCICLHTNPEINLLMNQKEGQNTV